MEEFGSDFHYIDIVTPVNHHLLDNCIFFAYGRHPLLAVLINNKFKRVWLPEYYCYEVVDYLRNKGIEIAFYFDNPFCDVQDLAFNDIRFREGDVLLRINFFGLRRFSSNINFNIPVIEDHSHDLLGEWASHSDADWCFASLRKTLPVAEGGILWSPKNHNLGSYLPENSIINEQTSEWRWMAPLLWSP